MSFKGLEDAWRKADQKIVVIALTNARRHLPGLQRYWRFYEATRKVWFSRDLTELEGRLFEDVFRLFKSHTLIMRSQLLRMTAELSRIGFWDALSNVEDAAANLVAQLETRETVAHELHNLGFNEAEIEFLANPVLVDRVPEKHVAFNEIQDAVYSVRYLLLGHHSEMVHEGMLAGREGGDSPSSRSILRRILGVLIGCFLAGYDIALTQPLDVRSVASGTWTAMNPLLESQEEEALHRLIRYLKHEDLRLRGEIDLLSQKIPEPGRVSSFIRDNYGPSVEEEVLAGFYRYLRDYYESLPLQGKERLLRYLDMMGVDTRDLRVRALHEAEEWRGFADSLTSRDKASKEQKRDEP